MAQSNDSLIRVENMHKVFITEEVETHIEIAKRIGYIGAEVAHHFLSQTEEVGRMINGLRKSLRTRPSKGRSGD